MRFPSENTERIRAVAHQLWEDEGRPEGRADLHWQRAEELVREENGKSARKTRAPRKKVKA
jgi:hypothetical protein